MSVFLSSGSPRRSVRQAALERVAAARPGSDSWTSRREPAQQTWPWLKKMPLTMPSTAWSIGASSKTMLAPLPPSSSVTFLSRARDRAGDRLADGGGAGEGHLVDVRGARPARRPSRRTPVRMLTTPLGRPAWRQMSAKKSAESGVVSAGLSTTVLPVASAGAIFQASISSGKFQGMTWPGDAEGPGGRGRARRGRACRPSPRSRRSAPRPAGGRRRGSPGSACRCPASPGRPARGRAPG